MSSLFSITPKERDGSAAVHSFNKVLVSELLAALRAQDISRAELADRLGVDKSYVSRLLKGNSNPTPRTLGEILGALDAEPVLSVRRNYERHNARKSNFLPEKGPSTSTPAAKAVKWGGASSVEACT